MDGAIQFLPRTHTYVMRKEYPLLFGTFRAFMRILLEELSGDFKSWRRASLFLIAGFVLVKLGVVSGNTYLHCSFLITLKWWATIDLAEFHGHFVWN